MKQMKSLVYEGPEIMNIRTNTIPVASADEALIRVHRVGICGSEISGYLGQNSLRKPPLIMGHEFSGEVAEVGGQVKAFKSGDRVIANPLISCGICADCGTGRPQLCADRVLLGAHRPGAFAEYVAVPAKNLYRLPDHVSMDTGALTEPLACAVHVCSIGQISTDDQILIAGAGPIGLFVLRVASLMRVRNITVIDINEERLSIAEEWGAKTVSSPEELKREIPPGGFDAAVDAVGLQATRLQCVQSVRPGGRVVFTGLHSAESTFDINDIIRSERKLYGAFAYTPEDFEQALQWIIENKINLDPWIMHIPLAEGGRGFETLIHNPGKIAKILLDV